ncbi:CNH domain-containing protein [Ditylenchus destructor]|uniref:CNH domain-containing protein n=1 Tax=Ditylenchus destructor TaxID=166010 RepID=A0AAD4NGX1_9BILA|nr:CNH domain-containing protein [Ditylenchus destructor]
MTESEIFRYRAQTNCLETKLKRKQMELELAQEQMKNSQESLEREISDLKEALKAKEKAIEGYILEIENRNSIYGELDSRQQMEVLHERIGSLSATVESLQDRIDALQAEKLDLDNKLAYAEQDKSVLKSQINSLKTELNDNEGTSQQTSSYLNEEIEKLKHQKAQLRLEHLQLKKDYAKLEAENNDLKNGPKNSTELESKFSESEAQISRLEKENNLLKSENNYQKRQLEALQKSANEFNEKLKHYKKTTKENEESENARVQQLSSELQVSREKMTSMRTTLIELDTQCDRLMNKLKELDQDKISMQDENNQLRKESEELRGQVESQCKIEGELTTLREENSRLRGKIRYLENEVKESHTDHSQELARLAKQLSQAKSSQTQSSSSNGQLEAEVRQKDSHIRYNERQIQQLKKDLEEIKKEAEAERKRQCDLVNENTTLRQGLAEAIKKTGQYRDEGEKLKQVNESIRANAEVLNEKLLRLEDDVQELQIELEQKEKLASYLQSVVQPKQMQKINRNYSSLISTGSDAVSDIEAESQKCAKLERERNTVLENLERRRRILQEKQNLEIESVPLIKNNATKMPMSPRTRKKDAASPASLGTMRHEIPHRWKKQFISINISSLHCAVCFEGLPHFGHIYKCRECSLMVHAHCKPSITNTCGLPPACATFYVDPHSAPSGIMTGWIKLWRSDDLTGNKWRNSWAVIDDNKLSFYDDDSFATNNRSPFLTIDLNSEQWKIYNQVGTPGLNVNGITKEHMSLVIEIKLPSFTLFMLGPTMQAKERWVRALQNATNRRAFVQRRPSTSTAYSMLLGLDKPRNLVITCTQILDHDWLLMGCQEGLFVTTLSNPKAPFNVAGIQNIYFMEIIVEQGHEMLFAICGINRRPVVTHLQQLRGALKADQQPTIEPTFVTNIDDCHSCVVSKPGIHSKRYVYLATTDAIHILEFVRKLGVFQPLNQVIKTEEPCMCICSTYNGLIFGADNFHLVTWESGFSCRQLSIDNCPSDFPVAAIEISPTEFLLAFHNYGVFVDAQGKRSRKENIEWERVPLEFAFSTPHLYIVYCDFLEVATVPTNEGYDTPALTDDRSMFRCRSAHKTGFGNRHGDIMFAVSSADRVELHMFNSSNVDMTNNKSMLKRKFTDSLTKSTNKKKIISSAFI